MGPLPGYRTRRPEPTAFYNVGRPSRSNPSSRVTDGRASTAVSGTGVIARRVAGQELKKPLRIRTDVAKSYYPATATQDSDGAVTIDLEGDIIKQAVKEDKEESLRAPGLSGRFNGEQSLELAELSSFTPTVATEDSNPDEPRNASHERYRAQASLRERQGRRQALQRWLETLCPPGPDSESSLSDRYGDATFDVPSGRRNPRLGEVWHGHGLIFPGPVSRLHISSQGIPFVYETERPIKSQLTIRKNIKQVNLHADGKKVAMNEWEDGNVGTWLTGTSDSSKRPLDDDAMELDPVDHHRLFDGTFRTSVQDSGASTALLGYEDIAMPPRGLTLFEEVSLDIQLERPDLGLPDAFNRVSMRQFAEELKESDPSITDDPDKYLHLLKKAVDHDQALLDSYHYPSIRQCPVIGGALPPRLEPREESKARYVALNDKLCGEFEWYQRIKEGIRDEGGVAMTLDEWVDQDMHPRNREQPKLWT